MAFKLNYKEDGQAYSGTELLENLGFALTTSLNYALDGVTVTNQDQLEKMNAGSEELYLNFMEASGGDYNCLDTSTAYYVIIEATSTTASASGNVKIQQMIAGKWLIYSNSGTYETNRAEVFEYLFAASTANDGTTARVKSDFTSVTAIKTPDADDQGKRFSWAYLTASIDEYNGTNNSVYGRWTGTFSDTTNNTDCSSWSSVQGGGSNDISARWYIPTGTNRNSAYGSGSDEFGVDTSADELDNPADCRLEVQSTDGWYNNPIYGSNTKVIILHEGSISWVYTEGGNSGTTPLSHDEYDYDFYDDGSIPLTTAVTESDLTCSVETSSIATITSAQVTGIIKVLSSLTGSNTLAIEVSHDGGSNFDTITNKELYKITNAGTDLRYRFTITRANNTETDSVTDWASYYG